MELREALTQIADIRRQMARGEIFRGYRAATTAFSGASAILTGLLQSLVLPRAGQHPGAFVLIWVCAAAASLLVVGSEMVVRTRRSRSQAQRQLTLLAVEQFVPSLFAGALLTYVFCAHMPALIWMLPALWMMFFALGIFASARLLPRAVFAVGGFYLVAGILSLLLMRGGDSAWRYSPWLMAGAFGLGQSAIAAILYFRLERTDD